MMSEADRQGFDVSFDASGTLQVIEASEASKAVAAEGGCSAGVDTLQAAARAAGKSEILDQYAKDYPQGPHEKPQSMCPAFGSLRVGLRMKRTSTILSGSACCVYGLTFVSHFYGARRSVGYVPFNSETLVTGKLFEDIREAVHDIADPEKLDAIIVTNLCVPTASGVPLRLLPEQINGVRIVGIDVPGFGIPTHAEAKDVLSGAMLNYARKEIAAGPCRCPPWANRIDPRSACWVKCSQLILWSLGKCWRRSVWRQALLFHVANGANFIPLWTAGRWRPFTHFTPPASVNLKPQVAPL